MPVLAAASMSEFVTLLPSPTYAILMPLSAVFFPEWSVQVGQGLAGMIQIGEAVDDRNAGLPCPPSAMA